MSVRGLDFTGSCHGMFLMPLGFLGFDGGLIHYGV